MWMTAYQNGWGVEVDIRTHLGEMFLSHDPIESDLHQTVSFNHFLDFAMSWSNTTVLDFKESGLIHRVDRAPHIVCTDLIVPDQLTAKELGIRTLSRRSKYEDINVGQYQLYGPAKRWNLPEEYWIDYVYSSEDLHKYESVAKQSYVVSSELHGCYLTLEFIKAVYTMGFLGVCTDHPERYAEYA